MQLGKWYKVNRTNPMIFFVYKIEDEEVKVILRQEPWAFLYDTLPKGFRAEEITKVYSNEKRRAISSIFKR